MLWRFLRRGLATLDSLRLAPYTVKAAGSLAQLAEQLTFNQRVIGSSPIRPTTGPLRLAVRSPPFQGGGTSSNLVGVTKQPEGGAFKLLLLFNTGAISSAGRASALQAEGRRFEPVIAHQDKMRQRREKAHGYHYCVPLVLLLAPY